MRDKNESKNCDLNSQHIVWFLNTIYMSSTKTEIFHQKK